MPTADVAPHMISTADLSVVAAKKALRREASAAREAAHALDPIAAANRLRDNGMTALAGRSMNVISGYWPMRTEIDPRPLMLALKAVGALLALPAVIGPGPLEFRAWREGMALDGGRLGTQEPPPGAEVVEPDLMLVPLLAFDRARNRIGYGAAHYDATIAGLKRQATPFTVGVAYAEQMVDSVPLEPWDEPLDLIVTDRGVV